MTNLTPIPTAREIMTTQLVTLQPRMTVAEAIKTLLRHSISGAPVVDEDGTLLGVLSEFDCLRAIANEQFHEDHDEDGHVEDLMTRGGQTIGPDADLFQVAQTFVSLRVRRLPVLEGDRLLGQVSRRDVLRALDALPQK